MRNILTIILLILCNSLCGQNIQKVEQELLTAFKKVQSEKDDSLTAANARFSDLLVEYASKLPATMRHDFKYLVQEGLTVAASVDGLFRIYSWNTRKGGTAFDYEAVYQYKIGNKCFAEKAVKPEGNMGRYFSSIYVLKQEDKIYYIGLYHAKYSSHDLLQGVKLFAIENNTLNKDVKLIRTASGLQNELSFAFDLFKVKDLGADLRLIYFDDADKKLHIPVVLEDGKVTNRFIVYWFDGQHFERLSDR